MDIADDLNCPLCDLGCNGQRLEERSLLGSQSSVLRWDDDVPWSNSAGPGRSSHLVLQNLLPHFAQVPVGKDEADIATNVGHQFFQRRVVLEVPLDGLPHHRVLAHEDNGRTPEADTDLLHLLRPYIVRPHNEALGVLVQVLDQLGEIVGFPA